MAETYEYDLVVIGAGPGGYVAAIRAAQLGLKTAVIEKDRPGGVCLNIGCIPSKALIEQARLYHDIPRLEQLGVKLDTSGFSYRSVFRKSRDAAEKLSKGVRFLLKKSKIEYIEGTASLASSAHEVKLEGGRTVTGKSILVATGSRPREIPGFEIDEERVLSSTGVLMMEELPKSLLILGAGAIGVEFGYVFNAFGVEVTIVEMLPRILPLEDPDSSEFVAKSFKKQGVSIMTSTKAVSLERKPDILTVALEDSDGKRTTLEVEKVLVAVGRSPNGPGLGLEQIGVQLDPRGFIATGDYYETAVSGVYAIGDVIDTPLLAHLASKEGEIVAEHIAGHDTVKRVDPALVPFATYCEPQVGSFGLNSESARKAGRKFETYSFPYRGAGKAVAVEKPDGFVKILYDPETREILGAHAAGAEATELLHELLLAKSAELLPSDIAAMIHAHPTLSEAVMESARGVEGWAVHV
jgi:dihydrolipoamide dehydrogenase